MRGVGGRGASPKMSAGPGIRRKGEPLRHGRAGGEMSAGPGIRVGGRPALDFLLDASLMRPRYLIRLFETARRRAVTLGREKIQESDYKLAVEELGWQVLEDFDRELADIVPDAKDLLFELTLLGERTSLSKLRQVIRKKVGKETLVEPVVDILTWAGCIGVITESGIL